MSNRTTLKDLPSVCSSKFKWLTESINYQHLQSEEYLRELFADYSLPKPNSQIDLDYDFDLYYRLLSVNYRFKNVPYFCKLLEKLESETADLFVIKKGAQVGATTFFAGLMLYYFVKYKLPCLFVAKRMLDIEKIRSHISNMLKAMGVYIPSSGSDFILSEAGSFYFAAATTPDSFRGKPAAFIYLDEIATYPDDIGGEGDIISLAMSRKSTFSNIGKIFAFSTPTTKDTVLEDLYNKASKKYIYTVKCLHCNHLFSPTIKNLGEDESFVCPKCLNSTPKLGSIEAGEWTLNENEPQKNDEQQLQTSNLNIVAFKLPQYVSTLIKNNNIKKFYANSKQSKIAERGYINLVEADSVEDKILAPVPALIEQFSGTHSILGIDIHFRDFFWSKVEFNLESGVFCLTQLGVEPFSQLIPFAEKATSNICIDIGLLSNNDLAKNSSFLRHLLLCRGANVEKQQFVEFKRDGIKSTYYVYRQHTINYLLQLIDNGKFYIMNDLQEEHLKNLLHCFRFLTLKKTNSGARKWMISDEHHELTHHFDAMLYAFALLCHNKDAGRIDTFSNATFENFMNRGQKNNEKSKPKLFGVL